MWEYVGCLQSIQETAFTFYDQLECHNIWACEMWQEEEVLELMK
jgi:hypothetical protein